MVEKDPQADQGELFPAATRFAGTDPDNPMPREEILDGPAFPEDQPQVEPSVPDGLREAVQKERKRRAQLGKHSPLQRKGSYGAARPGDVLPGFGIVTHSNLGEAQAHGRSLDDKRSEPLGQEQIDRNTKGFAKARKELNK